MLRRRNGTRKRRRPIKKSLVGRREEIKCNIRPILSAFRRLDCKKIHRLLSQCTHSINTRLRNDFGTSKLNNKLYWCTVFSSFPRWFYETPVHRKTKIQNQIFTSLCSLCRMERSRRIIQSTSDFMTDHPHFILFQRQVLVTFEHLKISEK